MPQPPPIAAVFGAACLYFTGLAFSAEPNTLSPAEAAAGWKLLFDGHTTTGWRGYEKDGFPATGWHIQDGCLVNSKSNGRPNGSGGDLITTARFRDFQNLRFDWRISAGGNSGGALFLCGASPDDFGADVSG